MTHETHTIQVWPSGRGYEYKGDLFGPLSAIGTGSDRLRRHMYNGEPQPRWRKGKRDEWADIRTEVRAERYLDREVFKCDSMLVDAHLEHHDELPDALEQEWTWENVTNVYPDPSEWNADQCSEWLDEYVSDYSVDTHDIDNMRDAVRDHAEPADIVEWWAVTEWLARQLTGIGECVLDNAYGYWWGRCCTGQAMKMDGTLQEIARKHA